MGYNGYGATMSIYEACEAAGRSSGATVKDDAVTVYEPSGRPCAAEKFDTFDSITAFPPQVRMELKKAGFPAPSQVQSYTWPLSLQGKDVIGIAATGSGKTLAFLLPAFSQMVRENYQPQRTGPGLLVMAPTRELAQQTEQEAERFGQCIGMRTVALYGGAPKRDQMYKYRYGVHTVVACPGRLNDFLEGGQVQLGAVRTLVLDEADRMLDMGFEPQIKKILQYVPRQRHTLFFTATWPMEVRKLANEILYKPYKVMIGNRDELKGNQDITQIVKIIDYRKRDEEVLSLLREAGLMNKGGHGKALVFCSTKRMCEQLSNQLYRSGVPCNAIHGDKDQTQRDSALNGLKMGRIKVLVATDVAARGLDIKGVGLVVNYDAANNTEDYVHRIGRTARAGAKGFAVTFMTREDAGKAKGIIEVMERNQQVVPQELRSLAGSGSWGGGGRSRYGNNGWSSSSWGGSSYNSWGGGGSGGGYKGGSKGSSKGSSKGGSQWGGGGGGSGGSWGGKGATVAPTTITPLRSNFGSPKGGGRGAPALSDVNSIPVGRSGRSRSPRRSW